jgi:hypothetical protein
MIYRSGIPVSFLPRAIFDGCQRQNLRAVTPA